MPPPAMFVVTLAILSLAWSCCAGIFTHPDQLGASEYDFVVVGGGTAGLVVANRLSETNYTVLVIEAGGSHSGEINVTVPFFGPRASPLTTYDWNYTTVPQKNMNNRTISYPRGHLLGGSSSINFMAYTRGSSDDYDRMAEISGDPGWSWDSLLPYIFKSERVTPPADGHDITGQYDPSVHGHSGIHPDTLPGFKLPLDDMVLQVTRELPDEFPYNLDLNGGNQLGVGFYMQTVYKGERSSTATSYLLPFLSRPNLDVVINARALRILADEGSNAEDEPLFSVVEISVEGESYTVSARKEIILSAGSVNTPALLLHSGLGNETELTSLGITPVLNLPSVGKNNTDHPLVGLSWTVNSTDTLEQYTLNATKLSEEQAKWDQNRTGVLVIPYTNQLGFFRLADLEGEDDPTAGSNSGHFELLFSNGAGSRAAVTEGNYMSVTAVVVNPTSRGTITLNSSDPSVPPLINPNFLDTDLDRHILREAVKKALLFVQAPVFQGYVLSPTFNATTDDEIDALIRQNGRTIYHPVSTAAMSPFGADYGVVDPDLRVKGASGLRIVDASIFPRIPSAHTQIPVIIIAERASDIIKEAWK